MSILQTICDGSDHKKLFFNLLTFNLRLLINEHSQNNIRYTQNISPTHVLRTPVQISSEIKHLIILLPNHLLYPTCLIFKSKMIFQKK